MASHTLPTAKSDQWVRDTMNEWNWTSDLLFDSYLNIYSTYTRNSGKELIVVNLFAGSGYVQSEDKDYLSPALSALRVEQAPIHCIYLEEDADLCEALEARLDRDYSDHHTVVDVLPSNANVQIERLKNLLEPYKDQSKYNILCISAPRALEMKFFTIEELAKMGADFLCLHSLPEPAFRGPRGFITKNIERISAYLETLEWAAILDQPQYSIEYLTRLLADLYLKKMEELGYPDSDLRHLIKTSRKNAEVFLCYYSKQDWAAQAYIEANQVLERQIKMIV